MSVGHACNCKQSQRLWTRRHHLHYSVMRCYSADVEVLLAVIFLVWRPFDDWWLCKRLYTLFSLSNLIVEECRGLKLASIASHKGAWVLNRGNQWTAKAVGRERYVRGIEYLLFMLCPDGSLADKVGRSSAIVYVLRVRPARSLHVPAFMVSYGVRDLCAWKLNTDKYRCRSQEARTKDGRTWGVIEARGWPGETTSDRRKGRFAYEFGQGSYRWSYKRGRGEEKTDTPGHS